MQNICVIGLGYIGLPTAAVLANNGFLVHGVDVNKEAVELINKGQVHIYEPDLENIVKDFRGKDVRVKVLMLAEGTWIES